MSCGNAHETDCSEVLDHLYECHPCLEKYGLEQAVKKLVKRCCGHDDVPTDLRSKVMMRIELIRSGEIAPLPDQAPEIIAGSGAEAHP